MPKRKRPEQHALKGKRLMMHPCHLQQVYGDGFIRIANQVLQGRLMLLSFRGRLPMRPAVHAEAN
jgi:hypothetical protein